MPDVELPRKGMLSLLKTLHASQKKTQENTGGISLKTGKYFLSL